MRVLVSKMFVLPDAGALKAFVDIIFDDVLCVKGVRVIEGKKGLFVTMPREQGNDNKWYDQVTCLTSTIFDDVTRVVLDEYYRVTGARRPTENKINEWVM